MTGKIKILQVEVYKSPVKLKEPFVISLGPLEYAENVIVVIRTDNGITGFGECSPFMTINGESIDTAFIVGSYLAKALIGSDPVDMERCTQLMDGVIFGNSSIKSAFDIALYDIASQYAGLPLYAFLGGREGKQLETDYTVSIGEPVKMAADAMRIKDNGFRTIKVKLGKTGSRDVERINAIREAIGISIPLRIDANQGWTRDEALATLLALEKFNIQFCEEPIARWDYIYLPELSRKSPVPVMADESCCDHHDADRLIGLSACPMFNIKLGKSAGIYKALKIVKLAEKAGIKMQVGGFLESRLGFTASAHLSMVSDSILFSDFDSPLMFVENPVSGGIIYNNGGEILLPDSPGLGATVADDYLAGLESIVVK